MGIPGRRDLGRLAAPLARPEATTSPHAVQANRTDDFGRSKLALARLDRLSRRSQLAGAEVFKKNVDQHSYLARGKITRWSDNIQSSIGRRIVGEDGDKRARGDMRFDHEIRQRHHS